MKVFTVLKMLLCQLITAQSSPRAAIDRAVLSREVRVTNTLALLSIFGSFWWPDFAFHVIWSWFGNIRARGGIPHLPFAAVCLCCVSWMWACSFACFFHVLLNLRSPFMTVGPAQHFHEAVFSVWHHCKQQGFREGQFFVILSSYQQPPHLLK